MRNEGQVHRADEDVWGQGPGRRQLRRPRPTGIEPESALMTEAIPSTESDVPAASTRRVPPGGDGGEDPVVCRDGGGPEEGVHATVGLGGAATQDIRAERVGLRGVWRQEPVLEYQTAPCGVSAILAHLGRPSRPAKLAPA